MQHPKYAAVPADAERVIEGVRVVNITSVLDIIYPPPPGGHCWDNPQHEADSWDERSAKLLAYCDQHQMHYYARDREDFSAYEAAMEARAAGKSIVAVEDLS